MAGKSFMTQMILSWKNMRCIKSWFWTRKRDFERHWQQHRIICSLFSLTLTFLLILNNERHLLLSFTRSLTGSHNHSPHPFLVNNLFSFIEILWLFRFMWQQWVAWWVMCRRCWQFLLPRRRRWRSKRFFLDVLRLSILSWCTHACWRCCCGFTTVEKRS